MQNPLKQGLKQFGEEPSWTLCQRVAMQNPLKQGLKLRLRKDRRQDHMVAMQNPLKQGLKPTSHINDMQNGLRSQCKIH